jgi:hypothetical protein
MSMTPVAAISFIGITYSGALGPHHRLALGGGGYGIPFAG